MAEGVEGEGASRGRVRWWEAGVVGWVVEFPVCEAD